MAEGKNFPPLLLPPRWPFSSNSTATVVAAATPAAKNRSDSILPPEGHKICCLPSKRFALHGSTPSHKLTDAAMKDPRYPLITKEGSVKMTSHKTVQAAGTTGKATLFFCAALLAGCATSGDLEQIRQEARQGESSLRADLLKEQTQFSNLAKENESLRAAHAKISQSVREYLKAEEARHVDALNQVRAAMKALE
jgi:bacterioferritin (cytochrome b1)